MATGAWSLAACALLVRNSHFLYMQISPTGARRMCSQAVMRTGSLASGTARIRTRMGIPKGTGPPVAPATIQVTGPRREDGIANTAAATPVTVAETGSHTAKTRRMADLAHRRLPMHLNQQPRPRPMQSEHVTGSWSCRPPAQTPLNASQVAGSALTHAVWGSTACRV